MAKKTLITKILPLIIVVAGLAGGAWLLANPEQAEKRPRPEPPALLVETGRAESGAYRAIVEAMGQIVPAREATLRSQVGGEIVGVAEEFVPGGHFAAGEEILRIDPADYELAVKKLEAVLHQAEAAHRLEMGRQSVARDELEILSRTTGKQLENPELALRGPQREQALAELEKARSDLEAAKLALSRTIVKAPFDALVTAREAALGDKVSPSETLATLVGTDEYWVGVSVPVNELRWLDIPRKPEEKGSPARIILDGGRGVREGQLLRLTGRLDPQSRLAGLIVSVPDPLLLSGNEQGPPLILSDYVRVTFTGRPLGNMVRVPLSWIHDGPAVWLHEEGRLVFRPVEVLYEDRSYAYIGEGLSGDEAIVTSAIAVPVEGMRIRTMEEARSAVQEKMRGPRGPNNGEKAE